MVLIFYSVLFYLFKIPLKSAKYLPDESPSLKALVWHPQSPLCPLNEFKNGNKCSKKNVSAEMGYQSLQAELRQCLHLSAWCVIHNEAEEEEHSLRFRWAVEKVLQKKEIGTFMLEEGQTSNREYSLCNKIFCKFLF